MSLIPHAEEVVVAGVDHSMQIGDRKRVAEPIAQTFFRVTPFEPVGCDHSHRPPAP